MPALARCIIIFIVACVSGRRLVYDFDQSGSSEKHQNDAVYKPGANWDWEPLKAATSHYEKYPSKSNSIPNDDPRSANNDQQCGYQTCDLGKPDMLNVHLVAHTHDDVGWLVTVDQYYYQAVQYILDSVVSELQVGPNRRFIYVEIAYFYRWWNQLHDSGRHVVKGLVNNGRLEFILGGWCMNDEAATHYNAIIDQHTIGFKFLKDNFGDCAIPKIGWQIDPFGHSREQASLFAQFGFDGLFFGRLDFQDKITRQKEKTMEMLWQGSPNNLGDQGALLTGVNFNGYGPPGGFNFDQGSMDYIQDDERLEDYNKDGKVKEFLEAAKDQAKSYTTNHIMMTMGSDFQFQNGHKNFKNLDKLVQYVNEAQSKGSKVNVFYSSPSCYLYALNKANQTYTTKSDDFFPYAHRNHSFWTGYFVSRAALKGYVRQTNNLLQACKQLDALTQLRDEFGSDLKIAVLKRAMGVVQHHDAVSGTEKQLVAYDYAKRLAEGVAECEDVINYAYGKILPKASGVVPTQYFCPLINASNCPTTEDNRNFTVIAYNPLGRSTEHWVRIPVTDSSYTVTGSDGKTVLSQVIKISNATANIPAHKGSKATGELVFKTVLPPLGFTTYFVTISQDDSINNVPRPTEGEDVVIENQFISLTFDGSSGLLKSMTNKELSQTTSVSQSLVYYEGMTGNNSAGEFQASGAYIFRPSKQTALPVAEGARISVQKNGLLQEVYQTFNEWASQVFRIHEGSKHAEVEFTIGPIKIDDNIGREVVSRYSTDFDTKSTFYTDANGREVLKRVRDFRPTWKLNQTEPVAGNYYPINSRIYIRDETKKNQFTVMTDRSQGGGSIRDGEIEIMLHRRTIDDDALGVGEPLNETGISGKGLVVRGKHLLIFDSIVSSGRQQRSLGEKMFMAPIVSYAPLLSDQSQYSNIYNTQWSGLKTALPDNVHLLTLEQWDVKNILLRLEHFYEKNEDPQMSQPASVSLKDMFAPFNIASVEELTLGANQALSDAKRLQWNFNGHTTNGDMSSFVTPVDPATLIVKLNPMQIRTFEVTLEGGNGS